MRLLLIVPMILFLTACTSRGQINTIAIQDPEQTATVTIFRDTSIVGSFSNYKVTFANKNIYGIGAGHYIEFQVPPGEQIVGVKCFGGTVLPINPHQKVGFSSKPNEHYYFLISTKNNATSCARIEQISDREASKWLQITRKQE